MFEGMDASYVGGGFIATQGNVERRGSARPRSSGWLPVTTKDIHDLLPGQDVVRRGSHESSEVVLVGFIRSADKKPSHLEYLLEDNTGAPLMVNQMIEDERLGIMLPLNENTYVRVIGKVRTLGKDRGITAFAVKPLKSVNELSAHMLEVTYCKLFYGKDMIRRHEDQAQNKAMGGGTGVNTAVGGASSYSAPSRNTIAGTAAISSGLAGIHGEIHKFLASATTESGFSVTDIQKRFPQLTIQKIREHLELLSSEGHVYTTIDDDHYRTTDS